MEALMKKQNIINEITNEVFFHENEKIRSMTDYIIYNEKCQRLYLQILNDCWLYAEKDYPLLIIENIKNFKESEAVKSGTWRACPKLQNDHVLNKKIDSDKFEAVICSVFYTILSCEKLPITTTEIKDFCNVTLEESVIMNLRMIDDEELTNLFLNVFDRVFGRNYENREYSVKNVATKYSSLKSILKKMKLFIVHREKDEDVEFVPEGDDEEFITGTEDEPTNGHEGLPFGIDRMMPYKSYTINLNSENPMIETDSEDEIDHFDYKSHVHKITHRYCNHKAIKCPCMYSCRYINPENPFGKHKGYKIDETSYRDLCAILSELPTCLVSEDPRVDYRNHFVVRIALTTADKNIHSGCSRSKEEIMQKINRLRGFYLDELSPGIRLQYEKFVAEEDDEEQPASLIDRMKAIFDSSVNCLKEGVEKIIRVIKKMVLTVSEFVSAKISSLIETLFTKISNFVINQFDVEAFIKNRILKLKDGALTRGKKVAFFLIVLMFLVATEVLGIFVFKFASNVIFKITDMFTGEKDVFDITKTDVKFTPEGMGPISAISAMTCAGFGLATGQTRVIKEKCDFLNSVIRAGSGISLLMGAVFVILPTVFKDSMVMAWGTPEEKDAIICEDWIIKSTCVLRLSKIAKILASPEMSKWVKEQIGLVPSLIQKITTSAHRSMVLKIYSDLLKISSNLEQYHNGDNSREVPYSFHLSADPGFGKSLLAPVLINRAFDYSPADVYTRNQTEEYWSGYIAQPVVFIDEFLVNKDPQVVNRAADEYLKLISPSKFTPEFASTDNIVMGLKGTTVSPTIVITANNTIYGTVAGYPKGALDRRRRFVVEMIQNPQRRDLWSAANQINVSKMSVEDLNNAAWLKFNIKNNSRENPVTIHLNMNFRQLIAFLRDDMRRYQDDCRKMKEAFAQDNDCIEDPTEKLIAMMAEMKGAPRGTINYDNPIGTFFNTAASYFAEGNNRKSKKKGSRSSGSEKEDTPSQEERVTMLPPFARKPQESDNEQGPSRHPDTPLTCIINSNVEESDSDAEGYGSTASNHEENNEIGERVKTIIANKDIASDIYCTNVDRNMIHRHICLCCNKDTIVQRCDGTMFLRCASCERINRRIPQEQITRLVLQESLIISEEEMTSLREQRIEDIKQMLAASRMNVVYGDGFPITIWEELGIGKDHYTFANKLKNYWISHAKTFSAIMSVYVGIVFIRRLLNKKARETEPSTLTFVPEDPSEPMKKTTQFSRKNRYLATNWRGESSAFTGLKYYLKVNGKVLSQQNGMPICSSKFITHRHSLIDENGHLYSHGEITISYKDTIDTVPYSCNMIRELKINDVTCDFVMICLPPRMKINGFPNMLNKFWREEDFARFNGGDVCIVQPDGSTATTRVSIQQHRNYAYKNTIIHTPTAFTYTGIGNGPGWCGLLLESYGNVCPGMYIGMHVAGSGTKGRSDGLYGLALPITREMLEQLINYNDTSEVPDDVDFKAESNVFQGPGLVDCEILPPRERVILSRVSKIRPSVIAPEMPETPKKHLPLLSPNDPRAENEDPLVNMINDTLSKLSPRCDESRADRAVLGTMYHMRKNLTWIFPKRRLTFEEAVGGIPGLLTSMNRFTSAGYPLCKITKGRGKREYFWFDDSGKLCYDPLYKTLVMNFIEKFDRGECEKGRFVAYLKDELVSEKKIKQKRCRIIYGGDMIANTAFRMIFGSFVIAYNHSYDKLSHAVGLNQYSYDMDIIHSYLLEVGNNFVAGDFKGWDKNMNAYLQKKVYYGIMQTCSSLINSRNYESFYEHQVKAPVIVEKHLLTFANTQFSGCFFTTILNCLVHDAMLRYIFELNCEKFGRNLIFEEHVRAKILGDDHIYSFSDEAAKFMNPKNIQEAYKELGAEYTDDQKEAEVSEEFRKFEDLTFLGAHPRLIKGRWVGALKKDTITEMVLWTRDFNEDLLARCQTSIEMSSLWGEEYYLERAASINRALRRVNYPQIEVKPWELMVYEVSNRTAASEATYPRYTAEGNEGLVNLNASDVKVSDSLNKTTMMTTLRNKAVAELPQDLAFGLESTLFRESFEWSTSDIPGKAIKTIPIPFGLLELGDSDNVQNMPFDRFLFWNGDVKLTFQVNGTPFMCGLLAVYFMPLASYECELANISTTNHVYLQPDKNNTVEITIPFLYFRTVMNTVARATESLGTVFVTPISPLSSVGGEPVSISLYSSFHNSSFSIPRPLPVKNRKPQRFYRVTGVQESNDLTLPTTFIAEGAGQSTNVTNNYTNVGGTMPISDITNTPTADLAFAPDITTDLKVPVGLDNPPLSSGAIPVEQAFPGFSNSYGIRPTRDMQLMPSTFSRQQCMIFDPAETRIDVNCMRNCLMTTIPLNTSMPTNTALVELSLDSRLNIAVGNNIPVNVAVLNQFHFWRGDIEFTFVLVRTQYHSCRLQGVVAYGVDAIEEGSRSVAYSNIMDFSGENSVCSMTIQFNAQTEFLRTYEGSKVVDPTQNHSLGTFGLYIANQLVAPDTVPQTIDVLMYVRFLNVKVAVPRAFSPFTWNGYGQLEASEKKDILVTGIPQPVATEPMPAWGVAIARLGYLPLLTTDQNVNALEPGIYTARGRLLFINTIKQNWASEIKSILIYADGNNKRLGFLADNCTVGYIFPQGDGFFANTPYLDQRWAGFNIALTSETITVYEPILPTFFAEGNENEITDVDHVETSEITHDSEERPNVPHKVEPLSKFEFCPTDIVEIGRRYVRVEFIQNPNLDQVVQTTFLKSGSRETTYIQAATQVCSMWRGLFAAWAGSIKYRFFIEDSEYLEILFQPFFNGGGQFNVSAGDVIRGTVLSINDKEIVADTSVVGPYAREMGYPSWKRQYVDVSVPFQSHFNFLFTSKTQEVAPISSGTITLSGAQTGEDIRVYSAFGDDLRLGVYRPPLRTSLSLSAFTDGLNGYWA
ncbi:polyprotein [Basavirus sp.]|nr:polyprotein [Basavirus sp.]